MGAFASAPRALSLVRPLQASLLVGLLGPIACVSPPPPLEPSRPVLQGVLDRSYDARFYTLEIHPDYQRGRLSGTTRMRFTVTRRTDRIILDAVDMDFLTVRASFPVDTWENDGLHLTVRSERPLEAGRDGWVEASYETTPRAGFYFEIPALSGGDYAPHVYTQGEARDARYWFPCNDQPSDRAGHEIQVTIPAEWQSSAAGEKTFERRHGRFKDVSWRFVEEVPPYLFSFAAGDFVRLEDEWEGIPLFELVEPADRAAAEATFARTGDILRFYSAYTGVRYPYPKYAQTAVRDFPYGAMENVSATITTRNILRVEQGRDPSWGTVAHEAAHQWFGDLVTCRSWPEAWLNEGFATYFGLLYRREVFGEEDFEYRMGATIDRYTAACRGVHRRALVKRRYRAPMDLFFDGTIYPGGAARLRLLSSMLGETVFREGLRRYLEKNAYRSVTSEDLRAAMEAVSGRNLEQFFQEWVYGVGYPELQILWRDEGGKLVVELHQVQEANLSGDGTGGGAPPVFHFPLEMRYWLADGRSIRTRIQVDARDLTRSYATGGAEVEMVEFDPEARVPARLTVDEYPDATFALLRHGSVRSRVLALRRVRSMDPRKVDPELFWEVATEDSFPEVRIAGIGALARSLSPEDLPRILQALDSSVLPMERQAWLARLLAFPGCAAVADRAQALLAEDSQATSAERIWALRSRSAVLTGSELRSFLLEILHSAPVGGPLHAAALEEFATRVPGAESLALVIDEARPGSPAPIRNHALGLLEPWLEGPSVSGDVVALFEDALEDRSDPVRRAAAGIVSRYPAIFHRSCRKRLPLEPDARIRRMLERGAGR